MNEHLIEVDVYVGEEAEDGVEFEVTTDASEEC